jgi:phosphate:Na+ symporter
VVLLVMSLVVSHFVTPTAALALVLGANVGGAINPLLKAASPRPSAAAIGTVLGVAVALSDGRPYAAVKVKERGRFRMNAAEPMG